MSFSTSPEGLADRETLASGGAETLQVPEPEHSYPELHSSMLLHRVQLEGFAGTDAEQPSHWIVPEFVSPQALGEDVQGSPSPGGSEGVVAEQLPSHWIVPQFVSPQVLEEDSQSSPSPGGSAGVVAEQP